MPAAKQPKDETPKDETRTLALTSKPALDRHGKEVEGHFRHSDAFGMGKLLSLYDMKKDKHDRPLRVAAINVRDKMLDAHTARLDSIELTEHEWDMLKRLVDEPESHLKQNLVVDGKEIPMRDEMLQDMTVAAAIENLHLTMDGKPGLFIATSTPPETAEESRPGGEDPV